MPPDRPAGNTGCVIAIIAAPFVVLIGFFVGLLLRDGDDGPEDEHVTLEEGELDGTEWRVDAVRDAEGETCIFLYEGDDRAPLNGSCDLQPQDVTYGDQTVVFGRADAGDSTVTVAFVEGDPVDIDTAAAEGMDGRFYVQVVEGDLDVEGIG